MEYCRDGCSIILIKYFYLLPLIINFCNYVNTKAVAISMLVRDIPDSHLYSVWLIFALFANFTNQSSKWYACIIHTIFFIIFSRWFYSNLCSLPRYPFDFDYSYSYKQCHLGIVSGWIWDIENAYGVRDGVKETRVTRLLWRVPTTAIALSDWNDVPDGVWNITKSPPHTFRGRDKSKRRDVVANKKN